MNSAAVPLIGTREYSLVFVSTKQHTQFIIAYCYCMKMGEPSHMKTHYVTIELDWASHLVSSVVIHITDYSTRSMCLTLYCWSIIHITRISG